MNLIGIMQGRLSPPVSFRLQAFPWSSWKQEFDHAAALGYDLIEWLFEEDDYEQNPIWTEAGLRQIRQRVAETGVQVHTCCADYFMPHPFFRTHEEDRRKSIAVLQRLIENTAQVGVDTILLPVLEISEIRTPQEKASLLAALQAPLATAQKCGVRLGFETELPAAETLALVREAAHPQVGVYYDTGNNAAQGHDIRADAQVLAPALVGVHVKDRKRGGPSVLLGQGDADFDGFFRVVKAAGYSGAVILQAQFGPDYLGIARTHLEFVRSRLADGE